MGDGAVPMSSPLKKAAALIRESDCLIVTAGAGLGVDSGLPDFRGRNGFWKSYPPYRHLDVNYMDLSRPEKFEEDPEFGWGFHGHCLKLFRDTPPHAGFQILRDWIGRFGLDYFAVTSNVDGHFQKSGFAEERVYEVHGSLYYLQCMTGCNLAVWPNEEEIAIDPQTMRASAMPLCPKCGAVARPNVQLFADYVWVQSRCNAQRTRFNHFWKEADGKRAVVIEIGAGKSVPNIRLFSLALAQRDKCTLVRVNPRDYLVPKPHLSVEMGGLSALKGIDEYLR